MNNEFNNHDNDTAQVLGFRAAEASSLAELLTWKNENGIVFVKTNEGVYWVTNDHEQYLTPAISEAIKQYQDTVAVFVSEIEPGNDIEAIPIKDIEFYNELLSMDGSPIDDSWNNPKL